MATLVEQYKGWDVYSSTGATASFYAYGDRVGSGARVTTNASSAVSLVEAQITWLQDFGPYLMSQPLSSTRAPRTWGLSSTYTGAEIAAANFIPDAITRGIKLQDILYAFPSSGSTAGLVTMHVAVVIGATTSKFSAVTESTFAMAGQT